MQRQDKLSELQFMGTSGPSTPVPGDRPLAVQIGVAIVEHRGRLLVGVRDPGLVLGGMHEFPGGKCRGGETPECCAVRECQEETGLHVAIVELLEKTRHTYPHGTVELWFILCRLIDDQGESPNGNFQWVPVSQLSALNFPEGNRDVLRKISSRFDPQKQRDGRDMTDLRHT